VSVLDLPDAARWESWLAAEHEAQAEAWLRIARARSGIVSVTPAEALDVALCFGWIDGLRRACDAVSFLQRYSRRRPGSSRSKANVAKAEALIAAGRMRPTGLAEVAAAKADGRWQAAHESQRAAAVPPDLAAALASDARADAAFERLGKSGRYAVILPLLKARTPQTRATILARTLARLAAQRSHWSAAHRQGSDAMKERASAPGGCWELHASVYGRGTRSRV
jgi:uncharacterized protein YdeI (YjbR/CyaY-like superfamily)